MDWTQTYTILGVTIGMFLVLLGLMITLFVYLGGKIDGMRAQMHQESKDFHGRLVSLEERYQIKHHQHHNRHG